MWGILKENMAELILVWVARRPPTHRPCGRRVYRRRSPRSRRTAHRQLRRSSGARCRAGAARPPKAPPPSRRKMPGSFFAGDLVERGETVGRRPNERAAPIAIVVERGPAVGRSQFVGAGGRDRLVIAVRREASGLKSGEECETNFHREQGSPRPGRCAAASLRGRRFLWRGFPDVIVRRDGVGEAGTARSRPPLSEIRDRRRGRRCAGPRAGRACPQMRLTRRCRTE